MPDYNDSYIELLEEHIQLKRTLEKVRLLVSLTVGTSEENRDYERIFNEIYHIMLADDERIGRITS
ncbi:hypothetical protein ADMFC3_00100 [Geovibrio sp. ADMFC3]|jgi:hypothetical protein